MSEELIDMVLADAGERMDDAVAAAKREFSTVPAADGGTPPGTCQARGVDGGGFPQPGPGSAPPGSQGS